MSDIEITAETNMPALATALTQQVKAAAAAAGFDEVLDYRVSVTVTVHGRRSGCPNSTNT